MDDELKDRLKTLGSAINNALSDSGEIAEAIQGIRESGYDIFLVLEATIGLTRKSRERGESEISPEIARSDEKLKLNITESDQQFLKSLKIKIDEFTSP